MVTKWKNKAKAMVVERSDDAGAKCSGAFSAGPGGIDVKSPKCERAQGLSIHGRTPGLWQSLEGTYDRRNVVWFHVACATCSVCQRTSPVDDSPPGQTMSPPRRVQGGLRFSLEVKTPGSAGATERPATPRHLTQTSRSKIESTGLGSWDSRYSPRLPNWRSRRSSSAFISAEEGLIISTAAGRLHIGRDRN